MSCVIIFLESITKTENLIKLISKPKLMYIELTAMNFTSEYMSIDSECQRFIELPENLKNKLIFFTKKKERELKHYFLNYVINLRYEETMLNHSKI